MENRVLEHDMARRFFGYGRWDAPYWFIGPEQGNGPGETVDNIVRVNAWVKLGKPDLCDCKEFHNAIGEERWHQMPPARPRLQSTWRPLMLLNRTALNEGAALDDMRSYQRDKWGRVNGGDTCVIELCGLSAKGSATPMDRERFRQERIEIIGQKIHEHRPKVVVMYGKNEKRHWGELAGCALEMDQPRRFGSTVFLFTTHPNTRGRRNSDWERLGKQLRDCGSL